MILGAEMNAGEDLHDFAIGMMANEEGELTYMSDGSRVTPEIVDAMGLEPKEFLINLIIRPISILKSKLHLTCTSSTLSSNIFLNLFHRHPCIF